MLAEASEVADDIRFDLQLTSPELGYQFDGSNTMNYVAPGDDYTWEGAFNAATLAGAAVLATLAF